MPIAFSPDGRPWTISEDFKWQPVSTGHEKFLHEDILSSSGV